MIEYISPLETPKNIMIRAVYTGKKSEKAHEDYENLKKMLHVEPAIERFLKEKHGFKITMGEEHDYGF